MYMSEDFSKVIKFLRFPLIVGVVLIHSTLSSMMIHGQPLLIGDDWYFFKTLTKLLSGILAHVAVPLFFFISGYLFFIKLKSFNLMAYKQSIGIRIFSFVIPYMFWNLFVIFVFFIVEIVAPQYLSGKYKLISQWGGEDWFLAFWNFQSTTYPRCYQFWFIRDLIVILFLFSPLIYFLTKKINLILPILLMVNWFFDFFNFGIGLSNVALFFISLGAYFGITKYDFMNVLKKYCSYLIALYVILALTELFCTNNEYLHKLNILFGICAVIDIVLLIVNQNIKIPTIFSNATFFVYALHGVLLIFVQKILVYVIFNPTNSDLKATLIYLCSAISTIFLCTICHLISTKFFPKITSIVSGGR